MSDVPHWTDKVLDQLETFLELASPGDFDTRLIEEDDHLLMAPDLVEMVGGPDDGAECYPFITVRLRELLELFDEVLGATWNTQHRELDVHGKIDGKNVSGINSLIAERFFVAFALFDPFHKSGHHLCIYLVGTLARNAVFRLDFHGLGRLII